LSAGGHELGDDALARLAVAFLAALAAPDLRSRSTAASMLPLASTSARLHSIMPTPVISRSLATFVAVISAIKMIVLN